MSDYTCNSCKKIFSRKWNALRHNEQIHHGLAIIFNNKTGVLFKNSNASDNGIGEQYEHEGDEQINLDIFGRLIQPFEELEKALGGDVRQIERTTYLSNIIIGALSTSDPVKLIQDTLNFNHSIKGKVKMVSYVAQGMNISPLQAEIYLTKLIKSRSYYKNYTRYSKLKEVF
jgi:ribonucleotide reductase alpha subunit